MDNKYKKHWIPLESDPEIFTSLMHDMGVSHSVKFVDVWTLEPDLLAFIPRPVYALILIRPPQIDSQHKDEGRATRQDANDQDVVWLKQTIHNACGLYAILHAVCNVPNILDCNTDLDRIAKSVPSERIAILENSKAIETAHAKAAAVGSTKAPDATGEVEHHYICYVKKDDRLLELDGDLEGPLDRGSLSKDHDLLSDKAVNEVKGYIHRTKAETFGLMALVAAE